MSSLTTMYAGKINSPATTLDGAINNSATTISVADASVFPTAPNIAVIGNGANAETILYGGISSNDLTSVTRGFQGTAASWSDGITISRNFTAYDYDTQRTNITTLNTDKMENWVLEDGDGTEVTITSAKEVKFVEGGGVDINWTDTDNGTDADPYDLTFTINAAQTGITSIYATDLIIGEDSETAIDFGTNNEIDFKINNTTELTLDATSLHPTGNAGLDLGTASLEFKDAFFDGTVTSDAFAGPLTGNVTGTADVATVATTVTITDNESTNEDNAIIFTAGGDVDGGNIGLESDGTLTYNPSTGKITATGFIGTLTGNVTGDVTGNVTGNTSGTAATVTGGTQAAITNVANVVEVGALNAGSITSGFGTIDTGSSTITTTGVITAGGTVSYTHLTLPTNREV